MVARCGAWVVLYNLREMRRSGLAAEQIELHMPDSHMLGSLQAADDLILAPGKDARPQHPPLALQKGYQACRMAPNPCFSTHRPCRAFSPDPSTGVRVHVLVHD